MSVRWTKTARQEREQLEEHHRSALIDVVYELETSRDRFPHRIESRNGDLGVRLYEHPDPPYVISFRVSNGLLSVESVGLKSVTMPERLFISYAMPEDAQWAKTFERNLRVGAERRNVEIFWAGGDIQPGEEWEAVLHNKLNSSSMALLLVSEHFLTSDYINTKELPILEDRRRTDNTRLLWVLVSACTWEELELLTKLEGLADEPDRPLDIKRGAKRRSAVTELCRRILRLMTR